MKIIYIYPIILLSFVISSCGYNGGKKTKYDAELQKRITLAKQEITEIKEKVSKLKEPQEESILYYYLNKTSNYFDYKDIYSPNYKKALKEYKETQDKYLSSIKRYEKYTKFLQKKLNKKTKQQKKDRKIKKQKLQGKIVKNERTGKYYIVKSIQCDDQKEKKVINLTEVENKREEIYSMEKFYREIEKDKNNKFEIYSCIYLKNLKLSNYSKDKNSKFLNSLLKNTKIEKFIYLNSRNFKEIEKTNLFILKKLSYHLGINLNKLKEYITWDTMKFQIIEEDDDEFDLKFVLEVLSARYFKKLVSLNISIDCSFPLSKDTTYYNDVNLSSNNKFSKQYKQIFDCKILNLQPLFKELGLTKKQIENTSEMCKFFEMQDFKKKYYDILKLRKLYFDTNDRFIINQIQDRIKPKDFYYHYFPLDLLYLLYRNIFFRVSISSFPGLDREKIESLANNIIEKFNINNDEFFIDINGTKMDNNLAKLLLLQFSKKLNKIQIDENYIKNTLLKQEYIDVEFEYYKDSYSDITGTKNLLDLKKFNKNKENALLIIPKFDHNGAYFDENSIFLMNQLQIKYNLKVIQIRCIDNLNNQLIKFNTKNGNTKFKLIVFGGHGSKKSIRLSQINYADFGNVGKLKNIFEPFINQNTQFILKSCSTGELDYNDKTNLNIAQFFVLKVLKEGNMLQAYSASSSITSYYNDSKNQTKAFLKYNHPLKKVFDQKKYGIVEITKTKTDNKPSILVENFDGTNFTVIEELNGSYTIIE